MPSSTSGWSHPDMTPILCEISTVNLQERFFEVLDAIRKIVLEPPVSTPIGHEISRLNSQECQCGDVVSDQRHRARVVGFHPPVAGDRQAERSNQGLRTAIGGSQPDDACDHQPEFAGHAPKLPDAVRNIKVEPPDLGPSDERFQTFTRKVRQEVPTWAPGLQQDVASTRRVV